MKNTEQVPTTAEEILDDLSLIEDPDKINNTLELLLECYLSSLVIDIHRRSEREMIYNHVNKLKELLDYVKIWQDNKSHDE